MEKEQLLTVIAVSIIVAVIASLATLSITGNTTKVASVTTGTEVYSKTEIDSKGFLTANSNIAATSCKGGANGCEVIGSVIGTTSAGLKLVSSSDYKIQTEPTIQMKKGNYDSAYAGATIQSLDDGSLILSPSATGTKKEVKIGTSSSITLAVPGNIKLQSLSGKTTSGYLCVSKSGVIFKGGGSCAQNVA